MKKNLNQLFFLLTFLFISTTTLYAIPAIPDPIVMTQPNGETLTVMIRGDERINWYESMDGYTLLFNKAGYLSYAQLDNKGDLQPSEFIATDIEKRDIPISALLNNTKKNLFYSDLQVHLMYKVWEIEDEFTYLNSLKGGNFALGEHKTICAFVQFPEKEIVRNLEEFEGLFNQLGYTNNNTGSVRDFFKESSYNKFDLIISLFGIYTAPQSESYYSGTGGHDNVQPLARWVVEEVKKEVDFRDFDSNNDGKVDGFHFIFAGKGREASGGYETIWSHKSSFSPPIYQNGKSLDVYSCSPELYGNSITTIGVICHEMTHAFGAPDFYDTNGATGGSFTGTGNWDIMAGGSWNGTPSGNRPAHHNMYTKIQFGWVSPIVLSSPTTITAMPNSAENPVAYRINSSTFNEYFLLENRQRIKFDSNVPGSGLLIYHVHNSVGSCINCTHPQRMYPVCAGRNEQVPNSSSSSYGAINSSRCTFPTVATPTIPERTEFTDDSTPAMRSWSGKNTGKPITNIKHDNQLISFDFMQLNINETNLLNNTLLKINPNPANEYIDIQFSFSNLNFGNIDFYNLTGQLVKSVPYNSEYKEDIAIQRISITDLSKGIYLVKAGTETAKLVIQ